MNTSLKPRFLALLATGLFISIPASAEQLLTSTDIATAIQTRGAESVAEEMVAAEVPFDHLLAGVESGKAKWLAIARTILPMVRGQAAKDLNDALLVALPKAPYQVLPLLYAHQNVTEICYQSITNNDLPGDVEHHIARFEKSLSEETAPSSGMREQCLNGIAMAKHEVQPADSNRFFAGWLPKLLQ